MSFQPNQYEIRNVLQLSPQEKYAYMLAKAVSWLEVWSCRGIDGWVQSEHMGRQCVPVWPAMAYAQLCCTGAWADAVPQALSIDDWLNRWLPGMIRDGKLTAIFPTPDNQMIVLEPEKFRNDLLHQLEAI
jgi:hypothetical protein